MKVRTVLLFLMLVAFGAFTFVNWAAFVTPTPLTLGLGVVEAPLGLILLIFIVVLTGYFLFLMVFQQAGLILETRRYAKELSAQRALADQAEASRFTELRRHLDERLDRLEHGAGPPAAEAEADEGGETLLARIDRLEDSLRQHVDQAGTSLSAYIGEVDDRIQRLASALPPG